MKSKTEEKAMLNQISTPDKEMLENLTYKLNNIKKNGVITEDSLRDMQTVISELMLKREQYLFRLLSLIKLGYKE
tara:strand:+ start:87 stop:311 length:225 start_codon:yes stop_codon:yes gene_type:complete